METKLKVPFALDSAKKLNSPDNSQKSEVYFCPGCHDKVTFRKGDINIAHFSHKNSLTCTNESITHKAAKGIIQQSIRDWKAGHKPKPKCQRVCKGCHKKFNQLIPDRVDDALLEYRLPEGFIVDVALMSMGHPIGAIEVKVTHAVDEYKHENISVHYLEVDGYQVVESPLLWVVLSDKLASDFCNTRCEQAYKKRLERERLQQERLEWERIQRERLKQERIERERITRELLEQEHIEMERIQREWRIRQEIELERMTQERQYWVNVRNEGISLFNRLFGEEILQAEHEERLKQILERRRRVEEKQREEQEYLEQKIREQKERERLEQLENGFDFWKKRIAKQKADHERAERAKRLAEKDKKRFLKTHGF